MFVLGVAVVVAQFITGVLMEPRQHPRLTRFCYYMTHYHPRLTLGLLGSLAVSPVFFEMLVLSRVRVSWRKHGKLSPAPLDALTYLDRPLKSEHSVLIPDAWQRVKASISEQIIQAPNMRPTHWQLIEKKEQGKELQLALSYVRDSIGLKNYRVYPRTLKCTARLKGIGVKTALELTFHACSPMDYATVRAIVDQTKDAIGKSIMEPAVEPALQELLG